MSQAIAVVGQIHLAGEFQNYLINMIKTGQILISPDDTGKEEGLLM